MKIIDDILKAERRADELMEKAQNVADAILKQSKAEGVDLLEKGRKEVEIQTSKTVNEITKTSISKVKQELKKMNEVSEKNNESSREKIPKLVGIIVKKVENV